MNDRSARNSMLLGLPPLIVAMFIVGGAALDVVSGERSLQGATLIGTVTMCVFVLLVWRSYIGWNATRVSATVGLSLLLLGQVLIWQPFWSMSGCIENDVLRVSQSLASAGLWCGGCALSWWGMLLFRRGIRRRPKQNPEHDSEKSTMSPNSVRLAIGMAYVPLLPGLCFMTMLALGHFFGTSDELGLAIGYQLCAMLVIATWCLLWRRSVRWTAARRCATVGLAAILLGVPWSVYLPAGPKPWDSFRWSLPLFVLALWFVGTALVWRNRRGGGFASIEPAVTDIERFICCPTCDYSLRGLSEVRCPECGWKSTVDDIVGRSLSAAAGFE